MEIRNYFIVIKKHFWWFFTPVILVIFVSLILSFVYDESYEAPVSFGINRKSQQKETSDYQYDSYYAIQANNILASQFTEWLKGGYLISSIYQRAGYEEGNSLLGKEWKVSNHSPQDIELKFKGRNKERISALASAAFVVVSERSDEFTGAGEDSIGSVTVPDNLIVNTQKTSLSLNLLIGLFSGILIGLLFVYFKEIFSKDENRSTKSEIRNNI